LRELPIEDGEESSIPGPNPGMCLIQRYERNGEAQKITSEMIAGCAGRSGGKGKKRRSRLQQTARSKTEREKLMHEAVKCYWFKGKKEEK